jgi:hypothetical protein
MAASKPPEILYESTGLRIKRNAGNRFCIARLHYTADPAKRSDAWKAEASAGMLPAKWDKEYEISYEALFGAKVFPEISTNREAIIVKAPYPEVPASATCWGGFDFGQRNPSSFHVYTIADGVTYSIWEHFEPCRSVPDLVGKIKECPYWDQIRYIAADPTIFSVTKISKTGAACSMADILLEAGLTKLLRGNQDEAAWVAMMRKHWASSNDPTFRIYDCCPNQIREFETAIFASMSDRMLATSNYRENIADYNNHTLDDCKYFMNSRPRIANRQVVLPSMVSKWAIRY